MKRIIANQASLRLFEDDRALFLDLQNLRLGDFLLHLKGVNLLLVLGDFNVPVLDHGMLGGAAFVVLLTIDENLVGLHDR